MEPGLRLAILHFGIRLPVQTGREGPLCTGLQGLGSTQDKLENKETSKQRAVGGGCGIKIKQVFYESLKQCDH